MLAEHLRAWERQQPPRAPAGAAAAESAAARDGVRRLEKLLVPVAAAQVADSVGSPDTVQISQAHQLRIALPPEFAACAESPERSRALLLATLVSQDVTHRTAQQDLVGAALGAEVATAVAAALPLAGALPRLLRLPAVCDLFPALRRLPRGERVRLAGLVMKLAAVDQQVDIYEFCLNRMA